jgi:hypothetical protein
MVPPMNRKLDVGNVLDQSFSIYRAQARVLLPVAFAFFLIVAVVNGLVSGSLALLPIGLAVSVALTTLYQGTVVTLVSDVQDGRRDSSVRQLIESATPVILPLIGAGILAGIAIGIGFLLLIVPGLFLATIWAVIAPAIVVERTGVFGAFKRSRELVRGHGWQVFAVIVIVFLIIFIVRLVLSAIAVGIEDSTVVRILFDIVGATLTAPIAALVAAVMYFALRDLEGGDGTAPAGDEPAAEPTAGMSAATPPAGGQPPVTPPPPPGAPPPGGPPSGA